MRWIDDDRLTDACCQGEMREVELWENERWGGEGKGGGWSKAALKVGERARGLVDGMVGPGVVTPLEKSSASLTVFVHLSPSRTMDSRLDSSSNLTFTLPQGWEFVSTEDWRPDICGDWVGGMQAEATTVCLVANSFGRHPD
jgi:hypothetical protein